VRCLLMMALVCLGSVALADEESAEASNPSSVPAASLKLIQGVADAVLAHHIDPPTRQQMILLGIKRVSAAAGVPVPAHLGRRVSELASPEQFAALIEEAWPRLSEMPAPQPDDKRLRGPGNEPFLRRSAATPAEKQERLTSEFIEGMLQAVTGESLLVPTKEAKVREQIEGNLYVGIHIALAMNSEIERPEIAKAFPGGPAHRAGVRDHDIIERIDGKETHKQKLTEAVDRLRGEEGTAVEIEVRQPNSKDVRRYKIIRGRLPRATITGIRERDAGGWDVRVEASAPIAYLKVGSIIGSTPHELRQLATQLESEGYRALILDLRGVSEASLHATVLLADELLDGGSIGRSRMADQVMTYEAQPDALFRGWPLAVLIDGTTRGPSAWLAAALQDNQRAILVGDRVQWETEVTSLVPVAGTDWSIELVTQTLERADGRPTRRHQAFEDLVARFRGIGDRTQLRSPAREQVTPEHPPATPNVKVAPGRAGVRPAPGTDPKAKAVMDSTRSEAVRLLGLKLKSMESGDEGR